MNSSHQSARFAGVAAPRLNILIVDDNHTNRKLLTAVLEAEGYDTVEAADGLEALEILGRSTIDGVVSDVLMPNMDGYSLCSRVRSSLQWNRMPFIFYTGTYTHAADEILALGFGANRFLRKPAPARVISAMIKELIAEKESSPAASASGEDLNVMKQYSQALVRKLEKRNSQLTEQSEALHVSESRLQTIFDAEPDCVHVVDRAGKITESNPAGLALYEADSIAQLAEFATAGFVALEYRESFAAAVEAVWRGEKGNVEFEMEGLRGTRRWVEMHAAPLRDSQGEIVALLGIARDNTARRELELQFVQAQKMEVIGHLAGGIAHDFNNMIGIIMGYSEIMLDELPGDSSMHKDMLTIFHTAQRAAALTRQLLIFSRKETPQPKVLDLGELITAIDPLLRRLIGENITMVTEPGVGLGAIEADPGQIEQVLMNLIVNARDAMPDGGTITISTSTASVCCDDTGLTSYAVLSVADDGCGMSAETKAKIFDAFFTTKLPGVGTGLGLATCQSIARRWGGYITVDSALGSGTKFEIYLPVVRRAVDIAMPSGHADPLPRGKETILVVEDEPGLRDLAASVLGRQGYTVLKAANGQEALRIVCDRREGPINLVLTDMVMPEMGGKAMAEWLQATNPEIKLLFTSGYTECGLDGAFEADIAYLPKPYTPSALVRKAREVIDAPCLAAAV
jgi:PAS domain S-box-containing protein